LRLKNLFFEGDLDKRGSNIRNTKLQTKKHKKHKVTNKKTQKHKVPNKKTQKTQCYKQKNT